MLASLIADVREAGHAAFDSGDAERTLQLQGWLKTLERMSQDAAAIAIEAPVAAVAAVAELVPKQKSQPLPEPEPPKPEPVLEPKPVPVADPEVLVVPVAAKKAAKPKAPDRPNRAIFDERRRIFFDKVKKLDDTDPEKWSPSESLYMRGLLCEGRSLIEASKRLDEDTEVLCEEWERLEVLVSQVNPQFFGAKMTRAHSDELWEDYGLMYYTASLVWQWVDLEKSVAPKHTPQSLKGLLDSASAALVWFTETLRTGQVGESDIFDLLKEVKEIVSDRNIPVKWLRSAERPVRNTWPRPSSSGTGSTAC